MTVVFILYYHFNALQYPVAMPTCVADLPIAFEPHWGSQVHNCSFDSNIFLQIPYSVNYWRWKILTNRFQDVFDG